jgi:hypothetical protein
MSSLMRLAPFAVRFSRLASGASAVQAANSDRPMADSEIVKSEQQNSE